ncbi:MAG: fibronectin type III domain-containing protein [Bacteroidales bacterium]|nr:fibronectin type III domain-containing protein [Bacteroidales bacterium]
MKRKSLLFALLLALFMPWAANAQEIVEIGDGTSNNYYTPIGTYYNYSITEQLYTAEEIGMAGTISSISFNYAGTAAKDFTITVYMMNVEAEDLSDAGISLADAEIVFNGTFSVSGAGWATITLDNVFEYDGASNLLIGFKKDAPNWFSGGKWYYTEAANMARYSQQDGTTPYTTSTVPATKTNQRPNIRIEITPAQQSDCETPTLIALDEPTDTEFSFAIEGGSGVYNIEVKEGSADWASYQQSYTGRTVEMSDLASNTSFRVRVQSVCDVEASGWAYLNFITKNPCAAPTNLEITDVTGTTATLSWTAGYRETEWTVKYKTSSQAWDNANVETVSGDPILALRDLATCTTYNVQVYNCENYVSGNFTTAAEIPLNEAFATSSAPTGWTRYSALLSTVMEGGSMGNPTSSGWNFGTGNNIFDSHAKANIYGTSCKYWLVTPTLLMEDNVQLTFDMALTVWSSSSSSSPTPGGQADDRFVVLIQTERGWEILREWNNSGSEYVYDEITNAATGQTVAINLSSYAGQNIAIAFYGESTASNGDNNMHIDNVSIDYIPSCAKPTGLAKSDVTAHEATISWTSDAAAWQVQLNDEEPIDVEETTYTFESLTPETAYTAKVRANCDGTYSEWTNAVSFTTAIACPAPTSFATSNVGAHSVTLSWTSDASEWVVAYKTSTEEEFSEITVTEKPYLLEGLDPETAYTVKVRSNCGELDGLSAWTTTLSFTTTEACPAPGSLTVSNVTVNGATLSWTELGEGTSWFICLNGDEENLIEASETTYTFDRLESETVYTAKVKSDCGTAWSSTVEFEPTAKLVIGSGTATSGYLPTNTNYDFSYTQQIYTVEELGEAGLFESIDFYMTSTTAYTRNLDIYMVSTDKNAFESNADWIAVTAADLVFSGDVAFNTNAWTTIILDNAFIYDGTQNVAIVVDDNTGVWNSRYFRTFTAEATQAHYCYQDNNNIDPSSPGATNNSTTTSKNQIRILKSELSDCMKPTHLTATEVGPDFAKLSWTENGESTEWVVVYNNESVTANTNEDFVLTGLDFETDYIIYVYPTCGESLMSDPITIHTLPGCPAPTNVTVEASYTTATVAWEGDYNDSYNVRYRTAAVEAEGNPVFSEDFEDGQEAVLANWTFTSMNDANGLEASDSHHAGVVADAAHNESEYGFRFSSYSSATDYNQYLVSPELTVTGVLKFYAWRYGANDHLYLAVSTTTNEVDAFTWTELTFNDNSTWQEFTQRLPEDVKYVAFKYYGSFAYYAYVDDIIIQPLAPAGDWNDFVDVTNPFLLEDLSVNTMYDVQVQGVCNNKSNESEWSEVVTFTTLPYATVTKDIIGVGEDNWIGTNNSGYYLIASPMMNPITPSEDNGFITDAFDLYYFDEESEGSEWRNYQVAPFDIVSGKGYIYASKTDTQLKFTGIPNTNGDVTLQKNDGKTFEGWNLVGNPFNQTAYLPAGRTFYTMDYDQNLIVEVSQGDERNIEAMQAVFVVAENDGETITFTTTAPEAKSAMVALNLNNRNGLIDRAIIRFDEGSTMPKLQLKRNSTKLYIPQDGNDYAVVRGESMGAMPVNFKAESNGSYTITLSTEEVNFSYLHLVDKVANTDVDLLANPSYSFDALTTDFANRFELVFATSNSNDDNFAFFNNGSFVINNSGDATLQVIDVNGRVLTSESINGCANVNVNAAAGVYMIRLVNGDNVKVQKVVVR